MSLFCSISLQAIPTKIKSQLNGIKMNEYPISMMPAKTIEEAGQLLTTLREQIRPHSTGLSNTDKQGIRSMSQGREGYARLVSQIASTHINSLPREHDPLTLEAALQYDADLEKLRQLVMTVSEMISETQLVNSANIMKKVDVFAEALQISRRGSEALDNAMSEVDNWNKRFGAKGTDDMPEQAAVAGTMTP
jgi:hypothetical protein